MVPLFDASLQDLERQRIQDHALDDAFQRTCAIGRIVSAFGEQVARLGREVQRDPHVLQPFGQPFELHVHDPADVVPAQRVEHDDVVDPVEKLRPEILPQRPQHFLGLLFLRTARAMEHLAAQVGRHDDNRVLEVDRAALAVRDPSVIQHLQQDIEDFRMGLFDFVEQDDAVRTPAYGFRQLPALFVPDVARRRTDQTRHGMLLHVFGHVDAHHGALVVEQQVRQRTGQLCFADAGGPQEDERADGPLGFLQTCAGAAHRVRHHAHALFLTDDPFAQAFFHLQQPLHLAFHHAGDGDAGPVGHNLGHVLVGDLFVEEAALFLQFLQPGVFAFEVVLQLGQRAVAQLGHGLEIARAFGDFLLAFGLLDLPVHPADGLNDLLFGLPFGLFGADVLLQFGHLAFDGIAPFAAGLVPFLLERQMLDLELAQAAFLDVDFVRHAVDLDAQARRRLVDQVDRLVRKKAVRNVAVAQGGRGHQRGVLNAHPVVHFVLLLDPAQDGNRAFHVRFAHQHRLEPPFERRVFLDVFAVLVEGGGADAMEFAAGEGGFQHVRGVHGALGASRPDQCVQLVNEQHDLAVAFLDFAQHGLHAVLEFAAELRARDQGAEVQGGDLSALEILGDVAGHDALRQALDDGRFAHARLADQHRVVLGPARQDLNDPADLAIASDNRVELARARQLREVAAELRQRLVGGLRIGIGHPLGSPDLLHGRQQILAGRAPVPQQLAGRILAQRDHAQQDVLRAEVLIFQRLRLVPGGFEQPVCRAAEAGL